MYRIYRGRYDVYKQNLIPSYEEAATLDEAIEKLQATAKSASTSFKEIDGWDVPWHVALEYIPDPPAE